MNLERHKSYTWGEYPDQLKMSDSTHKKIISKNNISYPDPGDKVTDIYKPGNYYKATSKPLGL